MTTNKKPESKAPDEVTIRRILDAPRDLVFSAWTDPAHVAQWWGPGGFTSTVLAYEMRPGGPMRIDMHGPDGVTYPMDGTVRDVVPPERLVFVAGALDSGGKLMFEVVTTVTFEQLGGKTRLTLNARVGRKSPGADQHIEGMEAGWTQSLERLAAFVEAGPK
jgi:uncharacterized protein YndB with AHSA1/START domain